jgi:hypothetical protein
VYTVFSIIRNKASIRSHRKKLPWFVHEGQLYPRPELKARKDIPTLFVSGLIVVAIIATPIWQWWEGRYRDFNGNVFRAYETDIHDARVGDCVASSPIEMQDSETSFDWSVTFIPCTDYHNYQVYKFGSYHTTSTFDRSTFNVYVENECTSDESVASLNEDKVLSLVAPNGYYWGPADQEAFDNDSRYYCFIGDDKTKLSYSLLK